MRPAAPLTIFVPHASDWLTDHRAHEDGAAGFALASRLALRGHDVHVAAPRIDIAARVPERLHLHPLAGGRTHGALARLAYMAAVRRLYARLRSTTEIDVIHQFAPVFTGVSLALADARAPLVLGSYVDRRPPSVGTGDSVVRRIGRRVTRLVVAQQQRRAAVILVTTDAAKRRVVDLGRLESRVGIFPPGLDVREYSAAQEAPGADGAPSILYVGTLEAADGIFTLLDAFEAVAVALPTCRLVVAAAGGGGWETVCRKIADLDAGDRVKLVGGVGREARISFIREATLLCVPAHEASCERTIAEGLACGKPVVATDVADADGMVDEGGGRRIVAARADVLARALTEVAGSPESRARMGARNRRRAEERYDWEALVARLEAIYRSVLADPRSRRSDAQVALAGKPIQHRQ